MGQALSCFLKDRDDTETVKMPGYWKITRDKKKTA
jgi:hypothetical protein